MRNATHRFGHGVFGRAFWALAATALLAGAPAHAQGAGNADIELPDTPVDAAVDGNDAAAPPALVTGFRSALFGMDQQAVLDAIEADFGIAADDVAISQNAVEKTTTLNISVPDLLPDAGVAQVVYLLGYQSEALIQIDVFWGLDSEIDNPGGLMTATGILVNYFRTQGFPPEAVRTNQQLSDGSVLIFAALDGDGRSVTLTLQPKAALTGEAVPEGVDPPLVMRLNYVLDTENPDIYQLPDGAF